MIFSIVNCKKTEPAAESTDTTATTAASGTTSTTGTATTTTADTWADEVTIDIGNELQANGAIVTGQADKEFKPGETVKLSMMVASAPANTPIKVVWMGPKQTKIGEETKNTTAGQQYVTFTSADTKSWAKGDYEVEIWFGDKKVATEQFKFA